MVTLAASATCSEKLVMHILTINIIRQVVRYPSSYIFQYTSSQIPSGWTHLKKPPSSTPDKLYITKTYQLFLRISQMQRELSLSPLILLHSQFFRRLQHGAPKRVHTLSHDQTLPNVQIGEKCGKSPCCFQCSFCTFLKAQVI